MKQLHGCRRIKEPFCGRVAQLGEHLLCKQGVAGSIPATSTIFIGENDDSLEVIGLIFTAILPSGDQIQTVQGRFWHRQGAPMWSCIGNERMARICCLKFGSKGPAT
jgi:hypothetical protein